VCQLPLFSPSVRPASCHIVVATDAVLAALVLAVAVVVGGTHLSGRLEYATLLLLVYE